MDQEIQINLPLKYPSTLKWYGISYIVVSCLFALTGIMNITQISESWWNLLPVLNNLLLCAIGYGIAKGKRIAFTLLYFVSFFCLGSLLMLCLTMRYSQWAPIFFLIVMAAWLLLPLFLVRPYWQAMRNF